jgi:hypothetical protein
MDAQHWTQIAKWVRSRVPRLCEPCRSLPRICLLLGSLLLSSCAAHRAQSFGDLPTKHSVRTPQLVIHSDAAIREDSPIVRDLQKLRLEILSTLALPEPKRPVVVYLFESEELYSKYIQRNFPKLPNRRAFFIGTATELAVYAFRSDHLAVDLRHEYTHGVLHSGLRNVPLWLDEGLAEYFEPEPGGHRINYEHLDRLTAAIQGGWQPDLARLEKLSDVSEMQALDYHEAWAWIYTWLTSEDAERQKLIAYIHTLRESQSPGLFSNSIGLAVNDARRRVLDRIQDLAVDANPHAEGKASTASKRKHEGRGVVPAGFQ